MGTGKSVGARELRCQPALRLHCSQVKALGFKPHNSLGAAKTARPTEKRKASVLISPNHPVKRMKNESVTVYTPLQLAPNEPGSDKSYSTSRHLSTQGSVHSHNGENKVYTTGVGEMRSIDRFTRDQNKRTRRDRKSRGGRPSLSRGSEDSGDPIAESSDSGPRGTTNHRTGHLRKKPLDQGDHSFVQQRRKVTQSTAYSGPTGRYSADDIDELSQNFISVHTTTPDPTPESSAKHATRSESLSTRGDIKSSLNQVGQRKEDSIDDGGVPLRGCVWLPDRTYTADGYKTPNLERCYFLRDCKGTSSHKVLQLFTDASDEAQPVFDDWFKIEAQKIHRVTSNKQHYLAEITLAMNLDTGTGAQLYLEFPGEMQLNRFLQWVRQNTTVTATGTPDKTLQAKYTHNKKRAEQHASKKTARVAAAATSRPAAHQASLDIRLMEKKAANRHEPQLNTITSPPSNRGLQVLDPSQDSTSSSNRNGGDVPRERQPAQRRSTRRAPVRTVDSVTPEPEIERWSETHPEWEKKWRMPLLYRRTTVEKDDIPRLDEDQCLNDNIIGFYLRYLYTQLEKHHPETARRIYFHNSFFYEKLKYAPRGAKINYQGVRNWTNKVDLFSYDYIVVPVNEHYHWWVAIICNPAKLDQDVAQENSDRNSQSHGGADDCASEIRGRTENGETTEMDVSAGPGHEQVVEDSQLEEPMVVSDIIPHDSKLAASSGDNGRGTARPVLTLDEDGSKSTTSVRSTKASVPKGQQKPLAHPPARQVNSTDTRIITLDSLGSSHNPACRHLKLYLIEEFKDKKKRAVKHEKISGTRAVNLPEQNNFTDCGVYLLKYIAEFLEDPDKFIRAILLKEKLDWDIDSSKTRNEIRNLIFKLHGEYQDEQEKLKREKLTAKQRTKSRGGAETKSSVPPSSPAEPASASAVSSPAPETGRAYRPEPSLTSPPVPKTRSAMEVGTRECHTLTDHAKTQPAEVQIQASLVDADLDTKPAHKGPMSVSDSHKQRQEPVLSIEIQDDDDISVTPVQQRQGASLRRLSPGLEVAMDGSDSKGVQFVKASPVSKKRVRSESQAELSPDRTSVKRAQSARLGPPDAGSSPPTRVEKSALGTDVVVSPYFSLVKSPGVRSPPGLLKTYAARHRKTPSQEKHSIIRKTPSKGDPGMTETTSPIDLTDD